MDVRHKQIILDNIDELVSVTQNIEKIVEYLNKENVLNDWMVKHLNVSILLITSSFVHFNCDNQLFTILQQYYELRKRTREFFLMLLGRGPSAFDTLLIILRKTENFRAEKTLSKT